MAVYSDRGCWQPTWLLRAVYPAQVRGVSSERKVQRKLDDVRALRRSALSLLVLVQLAAGPVLATTRVLSVVDGDSLWVLDPAGARVEVRLAEIDSPEGNQPYGDRARQELRDLVARKYVRLELHGTDQYGRTLAHVYVGAVDVNAEMVRRGAAWAYRKYLHDEKLLTLEKTARDEKRGLWALPESKRVPPWTWRYARLHDHSPAPSQSESSGFKCKTKPRCSEMSGCEEARFQLEHCGASRLDGDHDGVPCESLCR